MTRGKHAARSAQHRADAAEITADRYIEEAKKWKALALRNKAMAELTAGLQKEMTRLRNQPTVALADHERLVTRLRVEHAEYEDRTTAAMVKVMERLGEQIATRLPSQDAAFDIICVSLLDAVRALPEAVGEMLWTKLGFERGLRRTFAEPGFARAVLNDVRKEVTQVGMLAQAAGFAHNEIPESWVKPKPFQADPLQ